MMGRMMGRNGPKWGGMGRNGPKWGGMGRPRRVARANVVVGAPLCGRTYVRAPLGNVRALRAPYFRGLLMMYRRTR
jgi:hypothetical protein